MSEITYERIKENLLALNIMNAGYIGLSGKVIVSDPCYDRKLWCAIKDIAVKPGNYAAYIVKSDEQDAGVRVACIIVVLAERVQLLKNDWELLHGSIGVDSDQCGIFDDTIYPLDKESLGKYDDIDTFYGECCKRILSGFQGGVLKSYKGVVSSTGFGDGVYHLFCQYHEGERVALMVDFGLADRSETTKAVLKSLYI